MIYMGGMEGVSLNVFVITNVHKTTSFILSFSLTLSLSNTLRDDEFRGRWGDDIYNDLSTKEKKCSKAKISVRANPTSDTTRFLYL